VVLVDARGRLFTQADARRYATHEHLVVVCGRYEGVDARAEKYVDDVVSIGDYVLTGGELPALVIVDAVARLAPGVLGNADSSVHESHAHNGLLEHRQYTRPVSFDDQDIPPVLMSGNHKDIDKSRRKDALVVTAKRRPDLFVKTSLSKADESLLTDARVPALAPVKAQPAPQGEAS